MLYDTITQPCFLAWFGAICGHILSLYSDDFKGCQPFLRKMFPNKKDTFRFYIVTYNWGRFINGIIGTI